MKVRITEHGVTILGEPDIRIRGSVNDVELKLPGGKELVIEFGTKNGEGLHREATRKIVRSPVHGC